ncbi:MAG: Unknown protein [uncultured Sulfurovum sp.]|uniref:Uncharacterized protein n=1 Tax=uncultured Sulfurovum sp. TaxID=269237 RepID=A0A6S6S5Q0_9BACT|nr:MAG: Unknown protein [uncultured Sulfurovum sp.]
MNRKTLIKATVVTIALSFTALYAGDNHGGHGHSHEVKELSQDKIKEQANKQLSIYVENEKIDKSWAKVSVLDMKKKQFHHNTEWVVRYKNEEIKDNEKQIFHIFLSLSGDITGANYTGK